MRRGRPPKGLDDSLQEYVEIEYKFVEDYPEDEHFDDDDQSDLFDSLQSNNYNRIQELDNDEWGEV